MTEGKRPGGLTALAVLNFVFGGIGLMGALGWAAMPYLMEFAAKSGDAEAEENARVVIAAVEQTGGWFYVIIAVSLVSSALMIPSGIGYLQQKKFLGRTLGNVYAPLAIAEALLRASKAPLALGGEFHLATIVGLIYPLLTLYLLNVTFKEDFVR
jgi:hypothetical protein